MKHLLAVLTLPMILLNSCHHGSEAGSVEQWKQEIRDTEHAFAAMAGEQGIPEAFIHYAAEDAVMERTGSLVIGREAIAEYLEGQRSPFQNESLIWAPEFVEVSASGDLGYTYGYYTFSYTDSTGSRLESKGVFHTVWKKQPDGSWRFVWD